MDTLVPYPTLFRSWFGGAKAQSSGGLLDADRYGEFVEGVEGLEAIAIEREPVLLGEADLPAGHVDPGEDIEVERSPIIGRSEEHTSELQSLMRSSSAVFCLQKKIIQKQT